MKDVVRRSRSPRALRELRVSGWSSSFSINLAQGLPPPALRLLVKHQKKHYASRNWKAREEREDQAARAQSKEEASTRQYDETYQARPLP